MSALDRDCGMRLSAILKFPSSSLKTFQVAWIHGTWIPPDGTARKLKERERAIASQVRPTHRDKTLRILGLEKKTWDNNVTQWTKLRMAHQCSGTIVTLFTEPQAAPVPAIRFTR